jgi:hypothetical protein
MPMSPAADRVLGELIEHGEIVVTHPTLRVLKFLAEKGFATYEIQSPQCILVKYIP